MENIRSVTSKNLISCTNLWAIKGVLTEGKRSWLWGGACCIPPKPKKGKNGKNCKLLTNIYCST